MPYCWPEINRLPEVSPGKKGLFRSSRELQQRLCNHRKPCLGLFRARKGELFYKRQGRLEGCSKQTVLAFHWLSLGLERQEFFLLAVGLCYCHRASELAFLVSWMYLIEVSIYFLHCHGSMRFFTLYFSFGMISHFSM